MNSNPGFCHCCRQHVTFTIHGEWLRDQYVCDTCGSVPRQRHLQHILDRFHPGWEGLEIHESSPSAHPFIGRVAPGYSSSQYLPNVPFGSLSEDGIRSENLEALTFPDNSFDIFITQDVMEHIFQPDRASQEIARVLRPGGLHIFTTPKFPGLAKSYPRAVMDGNGTIHHLHPPDYHGNPVGDGKALVTWQFGDDFEQLIGQWSGLPVTTYVTRDRTLGIEAEHIEVFVMAKPSA